MKKIIVWALFDDGEQSVYNSLNKDIYRVISFGIQKKDTVEYWDATWPMEQQIMFFNKYERPDIIVASPMCQSFSRAAAMKAGDVKGNATWYYGSNGLTLRPPEHYIGKRYNYERQNTNGNIGANAIERTIEIIEHFKPKYWYVENPQMSMIWDYIKLNMGKEIGIPNVAHYGCYDRPHKKPTTFLSNVKMELRKDCDKKYVSFEYSSTQGIKRSGIPHQLIRDIFEYFKGGE